MNNKEARHNPLSGEVGGIETPEVSPEEVEKSKFKMALTNKLRDMISSNPNDAEVIDPINRRHKQKAFLFKNEAEARAKLQGAEPRALFVYSNNNLPYRFYLGLEVKNWSGRSDSKVVLHTDTDEHSLSGYFEAYRTGLESSPVGAELFLRDEVQKEIDRLTPAVADTNITPKHREKLDNLKQLLTEKNISNKLITGFIKEN